MRATFVPAAFKVLRKICLDLCARGCAPPTSASCPSGHQHVQTPALPPARRPEVEELDAFPAFKALPAVVKLALAQKLEVIELHEMTPIFAEGEESRRGVLHRRRRSVRGAQRQDARQPACRNHVWRGGLHRRGRALGQLRHHRACVAVEDERPRLRPALRRRSSVRLPDGRSRRAPARLARARGQPDVALARAPVRHRQGVQARGADAGPPGDPSTSKTWTTSRRELEIEQALPLELELDLGDFESEGALLGQDGG